MKKRKFHHVNVGPRRRFTWRVELEYMTMVFEDEPRSVPGGVITKDGIRYISRSVKITHHPEGCSWNETTRAINRARKSLRQAQRTLEELAVKQQIQRDKEARAI